MGALGSNINRVKNILAGDYNSATKTIVGHTKNTKKHKEGDVWEENGKSWTIKDGIKQNITKLDNFRKLYILPISCTCGKALKGALNINCWRVQGKCFDCYIKEETAMRAAGTFEEYQKNKYKKSVNAFLDETFTEYVQYLSENNLKSFITDAGVVEDWYGGKSNDDLITAAKTELAELKEKINSL